MFRSSSFQKDDTELVIIVTPHLVKPLDMEAQTLPTDQFVEPNDFEFYLLGRTEGSQLNIQRAGLARRAIRLHLTAGGRSCRTCAVIRRVKSFGLSSAMAVALVAGCATEQTRLSLDYGHSYNLAKSNQMLDPNAGTRLEPTTGMDGKAALDEYERYQSQFAKPPPPPQFSISIGESQ